MSFFGGGGGNDNSLPALHYNLIFCPGTILSTKYCAEGQLFLGLKKKKYLKYFEANQANKEAKK